MTNDEIAARLLVLEAISSTALALYLANSRNDPDYSKAHALLGAIRQSIAQLATTSPPAAQMIAQQYGDHVLGMVEENLRALRGEGGRSH